MHRVSRIGLILIACLFASCARAPLKSVDQAMRLSSPPALEDDLPIDSLLIAMDRQIAILEKNPSATLRFGAKTLTASQYAAGLRHFIDLAQTIPSRPELFQAIARDFDFYEVYGRDRWGDVFMTAYYEAWIPGSKTESARFSQPIYSTPADLVSLNLGLFDSRYSDDRKLRGRLQGKAFLPYYSREEIDSKKLLQGKGLEICWVDPVDAFFLQVQGSGVVQLENGDRLVLNYAEKNGYRYKSLGNFLRDRIPADQLNLSSIENYLKKLTPSERQALFNRNPSYVFFRASDQSAMTYFGAPATDGRTIATDPKLFPKGTLAFLVGTQPKFSGPDLSQPSEFVPMSRFVLDQDIGGAIQGPGRLDLFWGRGEEAKRSAGFIKQHGTLYYLVPKSSAQ